jgi:hypothetical protein
MSRDGPIRAAAPKQPGATSHPQRRHRPADRHQPASTSTPPDAPTGSDPADHAPPPALSSEPAGGPARSRHAGPPVAAGRRAPGPRRPPTRLGPDRARPGSAGHRVRDARSPRTARAARGNHLPTRTPGPTPRPPYGADEYPQPRWFTRTRLLFALSSSHGKTIRSTGGRTALTRPSGADGTTVRSHGAVALWPIRSDLRHWTLSRLRRTRPPSAPSCLTAVGWSGSPARRPGNSQRDARLVAVRHPDLLRHLERTTRSTPVGPTTSSKSRRPQASRSVRCTAGRPGPPGADHRSGLPPTSRPSPSHSLTRCWLLCGGPVSTAAWRTTVRPNRRACRG